MLALRETRPRLYRGESRAVWTGKLMAQGWPQEQARRLAAFLVGDQRTPPPWEELMDGQLSAWLKHKNR
jgi:hypothetical protein